MYCFSDSAEWVPNDNDAGRTWVGHLPAAQEGKPRLLLLHGNPASMNDWCPLASALQGEFELLAPDLPGLGRSDDIEAVPGNTRLDTAADCALAAATHFGWSSPFYVIGHSHGAAVALVLAARHPHMVRGVVLISTLGARAHTAYRQLAFPGVQMLLRVPAALAQRKVMLALLRHTLRQVMTPMFAPAVLSGADVTQQLEAFLARPSLFVHMARLASGNPSKQLANAARTVSAPVLLIHGVGDKLVPLAYAEQLQTLLLNAHTTRFDRIDGAGHMLHVTHAAAVRDLVVSWLARQSHGLPSPQTPSSEQ